MVWEVFGWSTVGAIAVCTILVCYVLVITARNPKAWVNRVVAPKLPEEPFIVHGDDWAGFY